VTVGDIHWVQLPAANGREQWGRRPAVILQTTIAARFQLDDMVAAHEMVEAAQHIGNVVVDIA
jgi:mRNA-degrading endonuclease toxin of MazEF toxin-antitoxin module